MQNPVGFLFLADKLEGAFKGKILEIVLREHSLNFKV